TMDTAFWKPDKKFYIEMKKQGPTASVSYIPCLDGTNHPKFIRSSAKGYKLKDYKPYAFGINFVNYIPTPEEVEIERELNFTLPSRISKWTPAEHVWTFDLPRELWYELDPADDRKKRWLKRCSLWFEPADAPGSRETV